MSSGDAYGNRTRVTAVKGRCLDLLTNAPCKNDRQINAGRCLLPHNPLFDLPHGIRRKVCCAASQICKSCEIKI